METLLEKLLRRNELDHGQLMTSLLKMDAFLCANGSLGRERIFDKLGLIEADRVTYREIVYLLLSDPSTCSRFEFYFPQPIAIVGLPGDDNQTITLDQGTGRSAMITRTILPQCPGSYSLGIKQIFCLGGKRVDGLMGFFGVPDNITSKTREEIGRLVSPGKASWKQVLWFEDGSSFSVMHLEKGEILRADYCFDLGGGYWGSRSDLTADQVLNLFMGGSGRRRG